MKIKKMFLSLLSISLVLASCASIKKSAIRSVADILSSSEGGSAFTSDDDPQLIAESLPLALKLYEILLAYDSENTDLAAAAGRNFTMYSGAFVQMPADMLDDEQWNEADIARKRAKKLFRRGRGYLMQALEMKHDGFMDSLDTGEYDSAIIKLKQTDASTAFWAGLAWLGMASTDPFDLELATTLDKAVLLLYRSLELEEANPGLHDAMIQVQMVLPSAIISAMRERSPATAIFMDEYYRSNGVSEDPLKRSFYHYYRALSLYEDTNPSPHITMATAVSIKEQDAEGFKNYLAKALAVDPEASPDTRLMTILYQEKARWLLDNIESFFLVDF